MRRPASKFVTRAISGARRSAARGRARRGWRPPESCAPPAHGRPRRSSPRSSVRRTRREERASRIRSRSTLSGRVVAERDDVAVSRKNDDRGSETAGRNASRDRSRISVDPSVPAARNTIRARIDRFRGEPNRCSVRSFERTCTSHSPSRPFLMARICMLQKIAAPSIGRTGEIIAGNGVFRRVVAAADAVAAEHALFLLHVELFTWVLN